jgi:hypothetical protein
MAEGEARSYAEGAPARVPEAGSTGRSGAMSGVDGLLLGLQSTAGNAAVARMLAARAPLAREGAAPAPAPTGETTPMEAGSGSRIVVSIAGVGEFEAESASVDGKKEIHLTKKLDKLSQQLAQLAAKGQGISVEIRFMREGKSSMTIKIGDGIISSYSHGGASEGAAPLESLSINGTLEVKHDTGEGSSAESEGGSAAAPAEAPA